MEPGEDEDKTEFEHAIRAVLNDSIVRLQHILPLKELEPRK